MNPKNSGSKTEGTGDKFRFYIDTNIFDYPALAHPVYGKACKHIIDDIESKRIEAHCSFLVQRQLSFSGSNLRCNKVHRFRPQYLAPPINMIQIDEHTLQDAASILVESGVSYDSIHAACMMRKGLDTIITEDVSDWRKIKNVKIIRPLEYERLVKTEK